MARALKVFRTPIGFHDAYVAAPSRKAALAAWGSAYDLFARGVAEEVSDPALTAEALASPGIVIRRSRGSAAEQFAALPPDRPAPPALNREAAKPPREPIPRPNRDKLDAAERAIADAEARHVESERALAAREADLARERRTLTKAHAAEAEKLGRARDRVRRTYEEEMRRWRG